MALGPGHMVAVRPMGRVRPGARSPQGHMEVLLERIRRSIRRAEGIAACLGSSEATEHVKGAKFAAPKAEECEASEPRLVNHLRKRR